jgi:UDPglucose 6-dehydrogenase
MKIAVIGTGYVGLVSAACFAELGHEVIAVDNDSAKVEMLCAGQIPIHEEHLPELVARHFGDRLHFSSDTRHSCEQSDVIFICVGTPPSNTGEADLSFVEGVARELAFSLDRHKVIVEKSTVPVGTCDAVCRTMLLYGASPEDFSIASNPKFLREGTAVMDFLHPDRILKSIPSYFLCNYFIQNVLGNRIFLRGHPSPKNQRVLAHSNQAPHFESS